jgi:hypothetical protein
MALDPPKPGQVIGYRYLWWSEHRKGQEEGAKDRPCAVVYAVETEGGRTRVYVLPITHTKPFDAEDGLQMLPQWKKHLGLDDEPSWVMTSELNHFEWPGPDIRGDSTEAISFGFLPHKVTTHLREMIRARVRERNISTVDRDFDAQKALDELRQRQKSAKDRNRKR